MKLAPGAPQIDDGSDCEGDDSEEEDTDCEHLSFGVADLTDLCGSPGGNIGKMDSGDELEDIDWFIV